MRRFSAAKARQHLSDVLDAAERGEGVVIERAGVQFEVKPVSLRRQRSRARTSLIAHLDPDLEAGNWSWRFGARGLSFVGATQRRKK